MRRSYLAAAAIGAPLLVSLFLIGCGRPKDEADVGGGSEGGGGATATGRSGGAADRVAGQARRRPARQGDDQGRPDVAAENAELVDEIAKKPDQKPTCYDIAPDAEKSQQKWVLDGKGGVGNVVVWIQPPSNGYFQIDPNDKTWPDQVELKQPHCAFIPHVVWAMPTMVDPNDPTKTVSDRAEVPGVEHRAGVAQHDLEQLVHQRPARHAAVRHGAEGSGPEGQQCRWSTSAATSTRGWTPTSGCSTTPTRT